MAAAASSAAAAAAAALSAAAAAASLAATSAASAACSAGYSYSSCLTRSQSRRSSWMSQVSRGGSAAAGPGVLLLLLPLPAAASGAAAPSGAAAGEDKAVVSSTAPAPAAPAAPAPPLPSPSSSVMLEEAPPAAAARLSLLLLLLLLRAWAAIAAVRSTPISPPDMSPSWRCAHAQNTSELLKSDGRFCTSSKRRKWRCGWSSCRWVGSSYPSSRSVRAIASGDASSLQPSSWCTCSSTSRSTPSSRDESVVRSTGMHRTSASAARRPNCVLSRCSSSYSADCSKGIRNAAGGCILLWQVRLFRAASTEEAGRSLGVWTQKQRKDGKRNRRKKR